MRSKHERSKAAKKAWRTRRTNKKRHLARCIDLKGRRRSSRGHLARCIDAKKKRKGKRRNPWTAKDVKRHNKRCAAKGKCRIKWPKIANAVLRKTGDEGRAIRIANWQTKRMGLRKRRK